MGKLKKLILWLVLLFIFSLAGFFIFTRTDLIAFSTNKSSESALIEEKLVPLSELTTLKYEYSNVIVSRTDKSVSLMGLTDVHFAEAVRLIEYTGYLKAGSDLSHPQVTYDKETRSVTVRIPKSRILDNVVETETTKVEDIKGNIFSDYPTQTIFDEINEDKQQLEADKISQGFLEEADERVKLLLTSFLATMGYEDIKIELY